MSNMTDQQLKILSTIGKAVDRIEHLERVLAQARDALSIALSDVEWRANSPTQKVIFKAHAAIDETLKS